MAGFNPSCSIKRGPVGTVEETNSLVNKIDKLVTALEKYAVTIRNKILTSPDRPKKVVFLIDEKGRA